MNEKKGIKSAIQSVITKGGWKVFAAIGLIFGVALLLIPSGGDNSKKTEAAQVTNPPSIDISALETRLSEALSKVDGAGRVTVILSLKSDGLTELSSNSQNPLIVRQNYPEFQGAIVIAEGADDPYIRLELTRAVASLLGLGTDKVAVSKMKPY